MNLLAQMRIVCTALIKEHSYKACNKSWPPVMMFKCLLLQVWYNLSDPAIDKSLARNFMFRRFSGLGLSESVPDHSGFWWFRNLLEEEQLYQPLLEDINQQLQAKGCAIKQGEVSIIDASVIKAKQNHPNKGKDVNNIQDEEAAYNVKDGAYDKRKTTYGFKTHINIDEDGFIKGYELTIGNVHDSNIFVRLLTGTEKEVYADSAYKSSRHNELLKNKGIKNQLLECAYPNKSLTDEQKKKPSRSTNTNGRRKNTWCAETPLWHGHSTLYRYR